MDDGSPLSGIILILLFTVINAAITVMKAAFENVNESSIKRKAEAGEAKALELLKILDKPVRYINVLELLICFNYIMIGIIYSTNFMAKLEAVLQNSSISLDIRILKPCYYIFITILLVIITTMFGTVLPKKFAIKHSEAVSFQSIGLMRFLAFLFRPLAWILDKLGGSEPEENVTEDELISMVNEGHEQGVFDDREVEMISNIIELDEKEARDIMTHKSRIVAIDASMTVEEALFFMLSENYSRYPLYEGNRDNIIGVLHLKDVICAYISEELKHRQLRDIAREPYYVPDTQNINILFRKMQQKNIHMAIVIDEYGQTSGIVALEDFLEEIVGNIQDEYDEEEKMVISMEGDSCVVKGSISLEELNEELHIAIGHEDYDTLNGLLTSILGRIPADGEKESMEYEGYLFDILETKNKMIRQVRISKLPDSIDGKDNPVTKSD